MKKRVFGRVQKGTYAGVVYEKEIYTVSPHGYKLSDREPRLRFNNEVERKAHRDGISRKRFARLINANYLPGDLYATLTFDNDHYPEFGLDGNGRTKHLPAELLSEAYDILKKKTQNYIDKIKGKFKRARIAWVIGRGENTERIHVHMLMAGVPEHFAVKKWTYGTVKDISHLWTHCEYDGQDHGPDYTKLANYLFEHWEPAQGAHRYHRTRNMRKPDEEEFRPCRRKYSADKPPKPPKGYKLVEARCTRYGYQYFKYVLIPGEAFLDEDYIIRKPRRSRERRKRQE